MIDKFKLWERQGEALRDPLRVGGFTPMEAGVVDGSLKFRADSGFISILEKLKITLLVTREYEHLVMGIKAKNGKIKQTYAVLPHPSGLVTDKKNNKVFVAATRNPNAIWEWGVFDKKLMPVLVKYYPGRYYFHDLAIVNNELYGNSVGQNGVVKIDIKSSEHEGLCWKPKSVKDTSKNYLQLNSIAAGKTLDDSFFSASVESPGKYRPGSLKFKVDKKGVIFDGSGEVWGRGLTRPHSARLYKNKVWVDNSGYGTLGKIVKGMYEPLLKLPGWTRGLMIKDGIAFVGVSRVLPRFEVYAPGLDPKACECGIFCVDIKTGDILGNLKWPYGNQIFAIDYLNSDYVDGFLFDRIGKVNKNMMKKFYSYGA